MCFLGLTERRERKRARREIAQPNELVVPESGDDESEGSFTFPDSKVTKNKKAKKAKVPAGFALMHGFTATNVGKNRLTVSCGCNLFIYSI